MLDGVVWRQKPYWSSHVPGWFDVSSICLSLRVRTLERLEGEVNE